MENALIKTRQNAHSSSPLQMHRFVPGGDDMVIRNTHPEYANDSARLEKLREMKLLCRQKLAAARKERKAG